MLSKSFNAKQHFLKKPRTVIAKDAICMRTCVPSHTLARRFLVDPSVVLPQGREQVVFCRKVVILDALQENTTISACLAMPGCLGPVKQQPPPNRRPLILGREWDEGTTFPGLLTHSIEPHALHFRKLNHYGIMVFPPR